VKEVQVHVGGLELVERGDDLLEGRLKPQISRPDFGDQEEVSPLVARRGGGASFREEPPDNVFVAVLSCEVEEAIAQRAGFAEDGGKGLWRDAASA
jgi:hypothetical protein